MPLYSSRAAALALGMPFKEFDNLVSRGLAPKLTVGKQGRDRRIGGDSVLQLALAKELRTMFGCSWSRAMQIADVVRVKSELQSPEGVLTLRIIASSFRERLQLRLAEASEYMVPRKRGRPARAG